jgi:hypothetical protein
LISKNRKKNSTHKFITELKKKLEKMMAVPVIDTKGFLEKAEGYKE